CEQLVVGLRLAHFELAPLEALVSGAPRGTAFPSPRGALSIRLTKSRDSAVPDTADLRRRRVTRRGPIVPGSAASFPDNGLGSARCCRWGCRPERQFRRTPAPDPRRTVSEAGSGTAPATGPRPAVPDGIVRAVGERDPEVRAIRERG